MTKDELVQAVADKLEEEPDESRSFVDATLEAIAEGLTADARVTLGDLGIFSTRDEGAHMTHVPGQEEPVEVPAQKRVLFHPAPALRDALNAAAPEGE